MSSPTIDVACLCAAWCRLCDEYACVVEQVSAEFARDGVALRWHWIDIEDEAELLGDLDVETFPTVIVIDPVGVRFAGPLTPQADTLSRILRFTVVEAVDGARWPAVAAEMLDFAGRLRARARPRPTA